MTRGSAERGLAPVIAMVIVAGACAPGGPGTSPVPSATSPSATTQPTPTPAPAVGPGEPWILVQQFLPKATVILVRPDGTGLHSPTRDVPGSHQSNPDWSADGSQIVFALSDGAREDLWIVNADGTGARQLTGCTGACQNLDDPDWSPDGRTVLYSRNAIGADGSAISTLEQVDVASGEIEVIVRADPGYFYAGQRFSPDGVSIVLEVVELNEAETDVADVSLAIIDVAAPTPAGRTLAGGGTFPETAAWAPSGDEVVFGALAAPGAGSLDLFAIRPDGTGIRRLTTLSEQGGNATHPDVSPDGDWVYFVASLPGKGDVIAKVAISGGGEIQPGFDSGYIAGYHPRVRPIP